MSRSTRPLVTVGIPFHDEERVLAAAIRSVLAQTVTEIEVLLVDDGSTDGSLEIARSFRDERIVVISDGQRRRLPARLNEIASRARGSLVARMDADDVAHPRRLERQLEALASHPSCAAVGAWIGLVDDDNVPFAVVAPGLSPPSPAEALDRGILPHATMVARRDWLLENRYDERLDRTEDRDLWCRTVSTSSFVIVPEVLYVVRVAARGRDFLPDYLASQRQTRALIVRYGPSTYGLAHTAKSWLASQAKSIVMRSAAVTQMSDRIVRRRGRPPRAEELTLIREALAAGGLVEGQRA